MDPGRGEDATDLEPAGYSTGWVARRLRVAPATLRTWHRRYGIGPTGRTVGGHRRYLPQDLDRLERMRRLMLTGLPTAEAARVSTDPGSGPPSVATEPRRGGRAGVAERGDRQLRRLTSAAMALDQLVVEPLLAGALPRRGVVPTWTELIVPVLVEMGERYERGGDCVEVEHLFTECTRTALSSVIRRRRRWDGYPPALLACLDREQHSLTLHALGAALAEIGCRVASWAPRSPRTRWCPRYGSSPRARSSSGRTAQPPLACPTCRPYSGARSPRSPPAVRDGTASPFPLRSPASTHSPPRSRPCPTS